MAGSTREVPLDDAVTAVLLVVYSECDEVLGRASMRKLRYGSKFAAATPNALVVTLVGLRVEILIISKICAD